MAKLHLRFEQALVKEYELKDGTSMTIGRLPDNAVHIDNLAVSGHHARIVWEKDHFSLQDDNSLNGTFVNNRRISRCALKHGDIILIGKHTLAYFDEAGREGQASEQAAQVPAMDSTAVLETRKARDLRASSGGASAAAAPAMERIGLLQVMDGKTDQSRYVLSSKLTVIGKSDMASIKLKGWFAPKVAAVVTRRDGKYFIAASEKDIKVKVNNADIVGPKELNPGDVVEVAGVKLGFSYGA